MSNSFEYIDIILLAMIAGFIFLRLKNVLGRKTDSEGKKVKKFYPRGMEVIQDIENNEAIKTNNVDEDAKKHFLIGAKIAYEQIVTSFAKGDKKTLKPLLNKEMYQKFSEAIEERDKKKLKNETTFIGIKSTDIKEFKKEDNIKHIKEELLNPIIEHIIHQLYPYFLRLTFGIISLLILLIVILFLNIRIIYYK